MRPCRAVVAYAGCIGVNWLAELWPASNAGISTMRLFVFAAAAVAVLGGLSGLAVAQDATVLARVNGGDITRADVDDVIARLGPQAQQAPLQLIVDQVVDRLISQRLLGAAGRERGLAEDAEVTDLLAEARESIIQQVYLRRYLEAQVTEEAVQARYDETVGAVEPEIEVQASHILVSEEEAATTIIEELAAGADFATLAQERSEGPSASRGGDLGFFKRGDMVPPFADAAFSLEPGQSTDAPVQTQFGWHVIQVVDRREVTQPTLAEAREEIEQQIQQESVAGLLGDLRAAAEIERFNIDGTPLDAN